MESGILIEPLIDDKIYGFAIQAKRFSFSVKITNYSEVPSDEFTISKITISSEEGQGMYEDFGRRKFHVGILNPSESTIVSIANTGQFIYGLIKIDIGITPNDPSKLIKFIQRNSFSGDVAEIGENRWVDFCYMKSLSEYTQEKSNKIMINLTGVLLFLTVLQVGNLFTAQLTYFVNLIKISLGNSQLISNQLITFLTAFLSAGLYFIQFRENNTQNTKHP